MVCKLSVDPGKVAIFIPLGLPCSAMALPLEALPLRRPAALAFTGILLPLLKCPLWSFLETVPPNTHLK